MPGKLLSSNSVAGLQRAVNENDSSSARIRRLGGLDLEPDRIAPLLEESEGEGFSFVRRVVDEWRDGTHRFAAPGEILLGAEIEGRLVALCGLMRDPYLRDPTVGRLRNVYVAPAWRGRGIGGRLTRAALEHARAGFRAVRLRAVDAAAARLYERHGFRPAAGVADCSHLFDVKEVLPPPLRR